MSTHSLPSICYFIHIFSLNSLCNSLTSIIPIYSVATEAQGSQVTFLRSQSHEAAEPEFETKSV